MEADGVLASPSLLLGRIAPDAIVCDAGYPKNLSPSAEMLDAKVFFGGLGQIEQTTVDNRQYAVDKWLKHISPDFRTLYIQQKAKRGKIQPYLKTKSGERQVDLCCSLAKMLRDFIGKRKEGLLFHSSTGAQLLQSNTLSDSLPILEAIEHAKGGFNIFRRFRITCLQKTDCPEVLRHFWSGHAPKHVSERYTKLREERDFRLGWAERIGLGFELSPVNGQLGQLRIVPKVA